MKTREKGKEVWEFRFYEPDQNGIRCRKTCTVGSVSDYPTESAARRSALVQSILLKINAEHPVSVSTGPTFGAVVARYETEELPERYSTGSSYKSYLKNYIKPRWSEVPLQRIKAMAVEDWLKGLTIAPKTKNNVRSLMHTVFQCAQRWELTDRNPMKLVRVKGGTKRIKAPRVLTVEQFLGLPPFIPEPFRTMVLVAGCLGLRVSEIVGLKWSDFDWPDRSLLVQRSVVHGREGEVKTEYSRDRIPLDERLTAVLLDHQHVSTPNEAEWVFANPRTGRPYHQEEIQKRYIRKAGTLSGIGSEIGWHTFRHSYRSWLDDSGAPMSVQKELMRHASIQTTMNVYGKAMNDSKRQANSKVVEMLIKKAS